MVPATGRESDAKGVCFNEEDRTRWTKPGAWRSIRGDTAWSHVEINGLKTEDSQSRVQYLWSYVPRAETGTASGDDEVDGMRRAVNPPVDRLTDELFVIGNDRGMEDTIPVGLEKVGRSRTRPVEQIIDRGCIADG